MTGATKGKGVTRGDNEDSGGAKGAVNTTGDGVKLGDKVGAAGQSEKGHDACTAAEKPTTATAVPGVNAAAAQEMMMQPWQSPNVMPPSMSALPGFMGANMMGGGGIGGIGGIGGGLHGGLGGLYGLGGLHGLHGGLGSLMMNNLVAATLTEQQLAAVQATAIYGAMANTTTRPPQPNDTMNGGVVVSKPVVGPTRGGISSGAPPPTTAAIKGNDTRGEKNKNNNNDTLSVGSGGNTSVVKEAAADNVNPGSGDNKEDATAVNTNISKATFEVRV